MGLRPIFARFAVAAGIHYSAFDSTLPSFPQEPIDGHHWGTKHRKVNVPAYIPYAFITFFTKHLIPAGVDKIQFFAKAAFHQVFYGLPSKASLFTCADYSH